MERLRVVRQKQHLTQKDIAAFLGVDRTTYVKYETGKSKPSFETLQKIADFFSVSTDYLLGRETAPGPDLYSIQGIGPVPATKKVPRLGTIACGEPILAVENIDEYDDAPGGVSCDFTLLCKGDSMIGARILDGDIVYIRQQEDVEDGEIAAVLIGNDATLKRVRRSNGQLILWPENPAYSPLIFQGRELANVRILGKAVAFLSSVR